MLKKNKAAGILLKYAVITIASALYAFGFCIFYAPNAISVGGFTGIGQIINHFLPVIPIGIITIILNIPLFVLGTKKLGFGLLVSSIYCMSLSSIFIDIISGFNLFGPMDDVLLASIFGGLITGISVGFQLKFGATSGGSELMARLLKLRYAHISVGRLCLIIDIVVILLYALTFRSLYNALYGVISMYVFSISVDFVIYGGTRDKMAYIISDKIDEVREKLISMNLGLTSIYGKGGLNGSEKEIILCAFKRNQISEIKEAVTDIDKDAFIIVCDTHEILGEGFGKYSRYDIK